MHMPPTWECALDFRVGHETRVQAGAPAELLDRGPEKQGGIRSFERIKRSKRHFALTRPPFILQGGERQPKLFHILLKHRKDTFDLIAAILGQILIAVRNHRDFGGRGGKPRGSRMELWIEHTEDIKFKTKSHRHAA